MANVTYQGSNRFQLSEKLAPHWYIPAASRLLINCGDATVEAVKSLLHNERSAIHALAAYVLGEIGHPSVSAELLEKLETTNLEASDAVEEVKHIIEALGKLRAVQAVGRLIQLLSSEELTFDVALALGRIRDSRALVPLFQQFKRHSQYASAVGCKFGNDTINYVLEVLADPNADHVHHLAIKVLGILGNIRSIEPVIDILTKTTLDKIEDNAVMALENLKHSKRCLICKRSLK